MSEWAVILSGFTIGLMGGFHCVGMCGPIALALPVHGHGKLSMSFAVVLYNIGRAAAYAAMGLLFGYAGSKIALLGYQQLLSISLGILVLLTLIFPAVFRTGKTPIGKGILYLKRVLGQLITRPFGLVSYFAIGFANGFLPCGLVYLGIASATATASAASGALLMFSFGIGTFPLMMSLMFVRRFISVNVRQKIGRAVPYFIGAAAVLLILRGMNLGIGYISPSFELKEKCVKASCCQHE